MKEKMQHRLTNFGESVKMRKTLQGESIMKKTVLRDYARLIVRCGVNVQKDQEVLIYAELDQPEFVKLVVEEAYKAKAKKVTVEWNYQPLEKYMTGSLCSDLNSLCRYIFLQALFYVHTDWWIPHPQIPFPQTVFELLLTFCQRRFCRIFFRLSQALRCAFPLR